MEQIDAALLATRQDIVEFLRSDARGRLSTGWRSELLGEQLDALLSGRAGLSFDGRGGLKMIVAEPDGVSSTDSVSSL